MGWPSWRVVLPRVGLVALFLGVLTAWLVLTPSGLLGKADAIGYAVCHRIAVRSFFLGDRQLPLCARCSGTFLGALTGLVFQMRLGKRALLPPRAIGLVFVVPALAFVLDGVNSFLGFFSPTLPLYPPQNVLRLATGSGLGAGVAAFLYPLLNQVLWAEPLNRPALESWRQVGGLLGWVALVALALYSGNPLFMYPLAVLSALGVWILLGVCYTLLWVIALRREGSLTSWQQALWYFLAGFLTALIQIALVDWLRYHLTGTWEGFPIPF